VSKYPLKNKKKKTKRILDKKSIIRDNGLTIKKEKAKAGRENNGSN